MKVSASFIPPQLENLRLAALLGQTTERWKHRPQGGRYNAGEEDWVRVSFHKCISPSPVRLHQNRLFSPGFRLGHRRTHKLRFLLWNRILVSLRKTYRESSVKFESLGSCSLKSTMNQPRDFQDLAEDSSNLSVPFFHSESQ